MSYVGRFAPSPTGPLHIGSLVAAVGSFLHARRAAGRWLVRIEDIDPPREVPGSADAILASLERLELEWDGPVLRQNTRHDAYEAALASLLDTGRAFRCSCTRRELREAGGDAAPYPGTCRERRVHTRRTAVRMRWDGSDAVFDDLIQGRVGPPPRAMQGDYVVYRRDGLPAYHLAVVVDDVWQGVTDVVRGADLVDSTHIHIDLATALGHSVPRYGHLPVIVNADGQKLSKGTGAAPVDALEPSHAAVQALALLGLSVPRDLDGARPSTLWDWALDRHDTVRLRGRTAAAGQPPG